MTRHILEANNRNELACQDMRCTHLLRNHANFALLKLTSSVPRKKQTALRRWPRPSSRARETELRPAFTLRLRIRRRAFRCMICLFHACPRLRQSAAAHRALRFPSFPLSDNEVNRARVRERERKRTCGWAAEERATCCARTMSRSVCRLRCSETERGTSLACTWAKMHLS